ncbi:DUF2799 domain-containing protein [Steroidobacter sp. S1-65]|uniref:DUF2799 domain-containing protein n=1 Tax=Steroidobacter gossypii TaxID=2805490 RepID=A0ABS1WQL0_9GAMM|nr:DUF2799 domain-containing protein [Steroidobacter gossypii]MBM0103251.1 DUF2799 domain-containing protein [Steroidobacter gossypii]
MPTLFGSILRGSAAMVLLALGACATMDREECLTVDWRTVGFEDGVRGYAGDRIGQHRKACAKHGVTPDFAAYQAGREAGLREFCVPANGFRLGSQGGSYSGICPADLEPAFADAYRSGQQLYTLESRLSNVTHSLNSKREKLRDAEADIVTRSAVAISSDATVEERAQAVVDVKQLGELVGRLKSEIKQLEEERVHSERDLQDYRATLQLSP